MGRRQNINHWQTPEADPLKMLLRSRYKFAQNYVSGVVVDAACAYGIGSLMLAEVAGVQVVYGIDKDETAIATAHAKAANLAVTNVRFSVSDLNTSPLPACDWLVTCETMEHLLEPAMFAEKVRAVATQGVVVSVPIHPRGPKAKAAAAEGKNAHLHDISAEGLDDIWKPWTLKKQGRLSERLPSGEIRKDLYKLAVYVPA